MKKLLAVLLAAAMVLSMTACNNSGEKKTDKIKFGLIALHDENSTYDKNFIDAFKAACEKKGVEAVIKTGIPEGSECLTAAEDLVDSGCNLVFADSFGHEGYMVQAAKKYPNVQFGHATGTMAHTEKLDNFHDGFASIYEGRYLGGIVAGMKLQEMIDAGKITADQCQVGYVGAFTYAEVISGYTAFFLGVKAIIPQATLKVQFTGSWYDYAEEKGAAEKLIESGCVLVSGHADSLGVPEACENAGVPNVSYNGSTESAGPNTYLVSCKIDWEPYFIEMIDAYQNNKKLDADYTGTIDTGSVVLLDLSKNVAPGTKEKVEEVKKGLKDGSIKVFDCKNFTVTVTADQNVNAKVDADGHLTSYMADVDTDEAYTPDTEVVENGVFMESKFRSAPYFDLLIDDVEWLNVAY